MSGAPSFRTYLVTDPVISEITSDTDFGVLSGGAQKTCVTSTANSRGNSTLSFNIAVPSQNTLVDRQVLLQVPMTFTVEYKMAAAGEVCEFAYGQNDAFQAFPMASIMTSLQATINNTTVSNEVNYSLPALLKVNEVEEIMKYDGMSPCYPDRTFFKYKDGEDTNANPLSGYLNMGLNTNIVPRGCFPTSITRVVTAADGVTVRDPATIIDNKSVEAGDRFFFTVQAIVTEPLFCSPFIWSGLHDNQSMAFLGINTIGLNINIDTSYRRLWSTMSQPFGVPGGQYVGIRAGNFEQTNTEFFSGSPYGAVTQKSSFPSLLLTYLTSQPSQVMDVRNVIPYMSMESKLTSTSGGMLEGASMTIQSSTFTLNQVPDSILIYAQKKWSKKSPSDSNSFLAIKGLNINFNNQAGLLSSASPEQLWRMSQKNSSNQTWIEFVGQASGVNLDGVGRSIATTGSMLVVSPAMDCSLVDWLSAGSLGQYQFQCEVQVYNQGPDLAAGDIELVCLFVNSGILQTEMGMSSLYTGLLDKSLVLSTKDERDGIKYANRVIGGGMDQRMMSVKRRVGKMGEKLKEAVKSGRSKLDALF